MSQTVKTLLLYGQPTLLRIDAHRALRLQFDSADFSFAAQTNSFLLAASEIPEVALKVAPARWRCWWD